MRNLWGDYVISGKCVSTSGSVWEIVTHSVIEGSLHRNWWLPILYDAGGAHELWGL